MTATGRPRLLAIYKTDCETCGIVLPALAKLRSYLGSEIDVVAISQSEGSATRAFDQRHGVGEDFRHEPDSDLTKSFALDVEVVPTLVLMDGTGAIQARTDALVESELRELLTKAAIAGGGAPAALGSAFTELALPENRPGCASRTLDPEVQRRRFVETGRGKLRARRVEVGAAEDEMEALFERGLTDGLPVVPPTEERVLRMLLGTRRDPQEVVAVVPPNLSPVTVEKVAINAVMAGCKPDALPVVLAAVEAACTTEFNMHGVLATTYPAAPLIIVNGPIRKKIGLNSGINALGQGNRANLTIGRALNLVVRNVGGGRPGEVDRAALGQPGKIAYCLAENEEVSPWSPFHVDRGFQAEDSTVTLFAGEAPAAIVDQLSRTARGVARSLALGAERVGHPRWHAFGECVLVLCPEHLETICRDGWSKSDLRRTIQEETMRSLPEIAPDKDCLEGLPLGLAGDSDPASIRLPKFRSEAMIHIVVAGGPAGKFSAVIGGWVSGPMGSIPVTKKIED